MYISKLNVEIEREIISAYQNGRQVALDARSSPKVL